MKIGLTGSIACGKSTVSQYLRQKSCFIVDADAISRALTADGGAALPEIRRAFGDDVFSGASLDRAKLGQLVFADAQKRETLNAILHPMILSEIRRQLDRLDAPGQIVVGDIPLLFECGMASMFDTVWVVRAARETQIQRLFERDGLSREQAERRIDSQMPPDEKIRRANAAIDTDGSIEQTRRQVDALLEAAVSGAPVRRRRPPQPLRLSDDALPERPPVPRRAVRTLTIETEEEAPRRHGRARSPFDGLPSPVRFFALALAVILLVTGAVSVTKTYLAKQEERRRLEAEAAERAQHPLYYGDLITLYAAEQSLDPALVSAVILCESRFDPRAESRLGARGLMQLMPDTAEWIAGKIGDSNYSFDHLYDAETNIRYGCWYLNYLSKLFRGDAVLVSSAYHAGQTTVTRWLSDKGISSDGVTIPVDKLPDGPTKQYAGRVTTSYGIYEALLYPNESAEAAGAADGDSMSACAVRAGVANQ